MTTVNKLRFAIGPKCREARKSCGLGTAALAKKCGLNESQVLDIELNRRNYTIDTLYKYLSGLGVERINIGF